MPHATGLFDVQQHTFSHVPFKDIVYSPEPGIVGTIPAAPPEALLEELAITSRLIREHVGGDCVGLRTPFGYYRGLRDRPDLLEIVRAAGPPLRHILGPQRGEREPDALGAALRLRGGGLPGHPRAPVPVLARRRLVRPARLRHGPGAARGAQGRGRRGGRARPRLRRVLPRLGHAGLGRAPRRLAARLPPLRATNAASRSRPTRSTGGASPAAEPPAKRLCRLRKRSRCAGSAGRGSARRARTRAPRRCSCRGSAARRARSSRPRRSAG